MRRKVLLIEAYTDANIGSGALVLNALKVVQRFDPTAEIRVMAHYPEAFAGAPGVVAVSDMFRYPFSKSRQSQVFWLAGTMLWMTAVALESLCGRPGMLSGEKAIDLAWADVVISVGAERLNDKYPKNIAFSLYTYWLAKTMGRAVIIFPSTIGPLFRPLTRIFTRNVLKKLDLVYVRDHQSAEIVRSLKDVSAERLIECPDLAVLQNPDALDSAQFRERHRIAEQQPIVGISAMRWTYVHNSKDTPYSNYGSYVEQMARLADTVVERYGAFVIFYPTNFPERGCREDDVSVAREIRNRMEHRNSASVLESLPSATQFQGMLSLSEVNITTRMHACILSTGAAVPTLSVNYLFKLRGYMASLGLEEFSIDIEEFNAATMIEMFDRMWRERQQWRRHLRAKIDERRELLWKDMERICDLV